MLNEQFFIYTKQQPEVFSVYAITYSGACDNVCTLLPEWPGRCLFLVYNGLLTTESCCLSSLLLTRWLCLYVCTCVSSTLYSQ